jgi:hypothetical protein
VSRREEVERLVDKVDLLGERAIARALARLVHEERKENDRQDALRRIGPATRKSR